MLRRSLGTLPRRSVWTRIPSTMTSPLLAHSSRYKSLTRDDFPVPECPTKKTKLPFSISRSTSSNARVPFGYTSETPRSLIMLETALRGQVAEVLGGPRPIPCLQVSAAGVNPATFLVRRGKGRTPGSPFSHEFLVEFRRE